jgi:UDP-N-acetylglucosamine 2-epimerase
MNDLEVVFLRIATVVGTRPQFIKAGIVSKALKQSHDEILINTGQHYDLNMSEAFFCDQSIPDYNLNIGLSSARQQLSKMFDSLVSIFSKEKFNLVLVYGDSRSTLAGALAAARAGIPLAHVEAGLRSYNLSMPEEFNRVLTDHLSSVLFCPSKDAVRNLAAEGFAGVVKGGELIDLSDAIYAPVAQVVNVGDVMCEAVMDCLADEKYEPPQIVKKFFKPGGYLLVTVHRAANTEHRKRLGVILKSLIACGEKIIFPVHPRTAKKIKEFHLDRYSNNTNILVMEPVGYHEIIWLIKNARKVVTDSGGIQKEAFMLGVPCITLREETEWIETVELGGNVLVGSDPSLLREALDATIQGAWSSRPYGRGDTSRLITRFLEGYPCTE